MVRETDLTLTNFC